MYSSLRGSAESQVYLHTMAAICVRVHNIWHYFDFPPLEMQMILDMLHECSFIVPLGHSIVNVH